MTLKKGHAKHEAQLFARDVLGIIGSTATDGDKTTTTNARAYADQQAQGAADAATTAATNALNTHAALVATETDLGHTKASPEIPVAGDGTMTLGDEIPHAVDFSSATQAAITASTTNDGSPAILAEAQGDDGTGLVGTGEAAGIYGEASGASGVGVAGKSSNTGSGAVGVAALLPSGAAGDLFRGLLDLDVVFRVRFDGSIEISGALSLPVRTVTADATAAAADYLLLVGTRAAAVTITLPDAADYPGRQLVVKDSSGQAATWAITIDTDGGTIDGSATATISGNYGGQRYASDGANWFIV